MLCRALTSGVCDKVYHMDRGVYGWYQVRRLWLRVFGLLLLVCVCAALMSVRTVTSPDDVCSQTLCSCFVSLAAVRPALCWHWRVQASDRTDTHGCIGA